jgi:hypothetical protein
VQTSPVDHVVRPRRHRGQVVLAAVAMAAALLAASALVLLSYTVGRAHAGADASSLVVDSIQVFDPDPTLPATQVSTATVTNNGSSPVTIDHFEFALSTPTSGDAVAGSADSSSSSPPPTVPLTVFPGENCTGATIPPGGYCAISVRYTNPGQQFEGTLTVFAHDGSSTTPSRIGTFNGHLDSILADPYVVDFGGRPVGETSPLHTVTIGAAPSGTGYQVVGVSVVDTVPTPGDRADYHIATDGCTGNILSTSAGVVVPHVASAPVPDCTVTVTDTPGGAGDRPAFLSVAYCFDNSGTVGSDLQPADSSGSPVPSSSSAPTTTQPPDNNVFCRTGDGIPAFHQLVSLTGAGRTSTTTTPPTTTTTTPPTTTTTTPPPTTTPTFTPKVTAIPPLAPAGRTTAISGTGFPPNTQVTYALVAPNTDPATNLSAVPGFGTATTDGSGNFADQIMVIMPHTPAGQYEILATALFGRTPVSASVGFIVAPGTEQPPKFVDRH